MYDTESNLIGFQGRALGPNSVKYITVMLSDDAPKIYGLDQVDSTKSIYIVEGPFDSTFVQNAVAMCGSDVDIGSFGWGDYIYVFDNEPRNREIVNRISKIIDRGDKIVIWPTSIEQKDINDMVLTGLNVMDVLKSNIYSGLEAKIKFNNWKKI
jgi:phosphosulfolactate synthase (CoM biosynthesis protein A)